MSKCPKRQENETSAALRLISPRAVFQPGSASMPMFGFARGWVRWDAANMAAAQTTTQSFTLALQKPSVYFWPRHEIRTLNQNNSGENG